MSIFSERKKIQRDTRIYLGKTEHRKKREWKLCLSWTFFLTQFYFLQLFSCASHLSIMIVIMKIVEPKIFSSETYIFVFAPCSLFLLLWSEPSEVPWFPSFSTTQLQLTIRKVAEKRIWVATIQIKNHHRCVEMWWCSMIMMARGNGKSERELQRVK